MKGSHRIIVESRKVKYDFIIKRNITILTGDSGSGKTVLIDLIHDYRRYGADSGVQLSCDRACRTIDSEDWERELKEISDSIIFIDEGNRFLKSKKFAELVQGSDNYFVIATREKLPTLPYSINEIYGFRESGKFHNTRQTYNELYHLYGEISAETTIVPQMIITEDSNSGYQFFSELAKAQKITCISADGKSNIIQKLEENRDIKGTKLIIADGAAFGSEMRELNVYLNNIENAALYAPESFEWLLLSCNIIPNINVQNILQKPEDYIESKDFVSWERFFTALLIDKTKTSSVWSYTKKKLSKSYLSSKVINSVKKFMKLIKWV